MQGESTESGFPIRCQKRHAGQVLVQCTVRQAMPDYSTMGSSQSSLRDVMLALMQRDSGFLAPKPPAAHGSHIP